MSHPEISETFLKTLFAQAEKEYPSECCGLILGPKGKSEYTRIYPCRNVQDEYRKKDPQSFSRTSLQAYFIDPKDLLKIQKEIRINGEEIKIIYHSHIDSGAYFSQEDSRMALSEGEPVYPGVEYVVMSVECSKVVDWKRYAWNASRHSFEAR